MIRVDVSYHHMLCTQNIFWFFACLHRQCSLLENGQKQKVEGPSEHHGQAER